MHIHGDCRAGRRDDFFIFRQSEGVTIRTCVDFHRFIRDHDIIDGDVEERGDLFGYRCVSIASS